MSSHDIPPHLHNLLTAECAAEAAGAAADPDDLRQAVRLRWLERVHASGPPASPAVWVRLAVRAEVRPDRRRARREVPLTAAREGCAGEAEAVRVLAADGHGDPATEVEAGLLAVERRRVLRAAVARLPGRCPLVLGALLARGDRTYRELAEELGISAGTIGPLRSRCLACLRRALAAGVAAPDLRGMVR